MIAIILGCATVVTLFSFVDAQKNKIENQFDEYGANIIIMPKSDTLSLTYGGINVSGIVTNLNELDRNKIKDIRNIPNYDNIRAISPKIMGAVNVTAELSGISQYVLLVGVNFNEEVKIKSWWEIKDGGNIPESSNELLIGSDAARILNVANNSEIKILNKPYSISGELKTTGSQDDNIIFADFELVSTILNKKDDVTLVEVSALCSDCPIDDIIAQIQAILPNANIKSIGQVMKQKMETTKQFEQFALTITIVIIIICSSLVFTSMMGSVSDRKHEIGIFRAIGFTKYNIVTIILTEALIICIIAGIIGSSIGAGVSYFILPDIAGIKADSVNVNFMLIFMSIALVVGIGMSAALYPAYKASDIDPVNAINSI